VEEAEGKGRGREGEEKGVREENDLMSPLSQIAGYATGRRTTAAVRVGSCKR